MAKPKPSFKPRLEELEAREVPTTTPTDSSTVATMEIVATTPATVLSIQLVDAQQNAITAQQHLEGDTVNLQAAGLSSNSATLTFSASDLPTGLNIDPTTGAISGTIAAGAATGSAAGDGNYTTTINATDGTNTASTTLAWMVSPRITVQIADASQSAVSGPQNIEGATVALQASATTPDNTTLTYSASNLPAGLSIDPTTGAITGTVAPGAAADGDDGIDGVYSTTISATDGTYTGSQTIVWTVSPRIAFQVVDAQLNAVSDLQNIEGDTVNLLAVGTTPDNTSLTYSATNLPTGLTIDPATGTMAGSIAPGAAAEGDDGLDGKYTTTVTVADGNYTTSQTIIWTVSPRIVLQIVDAQQNPVGDLQSLEGDTLDLQAQTATPDNASLTYSATNLPDGLSIDPATGLISGEIASGAAIDGNDGGGFYSTTFSATDGTFTASQTIYWNVSSRITLQVVDAQQNPATTVAAVEGDIVNLQAQGSSLDNTALTYSATNLPAGLTINPETGAIQGSIAPGAATAGDNGSDGDYTATISASDGTHTGNITLKFSISTRITVLIVDAQQNVVAVPQNLEGDSVNLQVLASSPDNTTLIYSATNLPAGLSIDPMTGAITGTIASGDSLLGDYRAIGSYAVTVSASDGTYTATTSLVWTITASTSYISITATGATAQEPGADPTADPGVAATFTVHRTGDLSQELTVHYLVSGSAVADADYQELSGSVTFAVNEADATITVTPLRRSDEHLLSKDLQIELAVPVAGEGWVPAPDLSSATAVLLAADAPKTTQLFSIVYSGNRIPIFKDPTGKESAGAFDPINPFDKSQIAYSRGEKAEAKVQIQLSDADATALNGKTVWVRGVTEKGVEFFSAVQASVATKLAKFPGVDFTDTSIVQNGLQFTATAKDKFDKVLYDKSFNIVWQYGIAASADKVVTWTDAAKSQNQLFVTFAKPVSRMVKNAKTGAMEEKSKVFLSAIWQGCSYAGGAKDEATLVKDIWSSFASRDVTRIDGRKMGYYTKWDENKLSYTELLGGLDSQCTGWATYFVMVLRAQGFDKAAINMITVDSTKVDDATHSNMLVGTEAWKKDPKANGPVFLSLVNRAGALAQQNQLILTRGLIKVPVGGVQVLKSTFTFVSDPKANLIPDITFQPAKGNGQNNDDPAAAFNNHVVVVIGNDIFDPSYGTKFTGTDLNAALLDFQKKSIFGFYSVIQLDAANAAKNLVKFDIVMQAELASQVKRQLKIEPLTNKLMEEKFGVKRSATVTDAFVP